MNGITDIFAPFVVRMINNVWRAGSRKQRSGKGNAGTRLAVLAGSCVLIFSGCLNGAVAGQVGLTSTIDTVVGEIPSDTGEMPVRTRFNDSKVAHGIPNGPILADDDFFGYGVTNVGDLDGDGGMVLAVGAIEDDTGSANAGALYLLRYNASGMLTSTSKVHHGTPNGPSLHTSERFGYSPANVGDLDGNGGTVIAVGAAHNSTNGEGRGAIYLLRYNASGMLTSTSKVRNGTPNGPSLSDNDFFGLSIANVGDLDGNGGTVLAVGAGGDDTGGQNRGAIYLLHYDDSGTLASTSKVHHATPNGPSLRNGGWFGRSIANVGDLDGGGGTVLAVGAGSDSSGGPNRGALYLLSYNANGTLTSTSRVDHSTTNGPTLADRGRFGTSIASLGDLNEDDGTVLAVGSAFDFDGGLVQGAMYLLHYNASGTLTGTNKVNNGSRDILSLNNFDNFGLSIANVGDLDGSGGTFIAVGAVGDDTGGNNRGALYLLQY